MPINEEKAFDLYRKAATRVSVRKGVVKDEQKATQRLRLAARQGLAEAQHHLGMGI